MVVPFVVRKFVCVPFVEKKFVDVALVPLKFVAKKLVDVAFPKIPLVAEKLVVVAFVPLKFVAKRFVEVAFVVVPNCTESCAIEDDALTVIPTVVVGVSAERSAIFTQSACAPLPAPPQAEPVEVMSPLVDWRQPVAIAENVT